MLKHVSEICDEIMEIFAEEKRELERWGITLWMQRAGFACYNELAQFYQSDEWKSAASNARKEGDYTCQKCRRKDKVIHVHHHFPIMSAYSMYPGRNFDEWRLTLYCSNCHKWFHENSVRTENGYEMAIKSEVQQEKEYLRKLQRAHDEMKECRFCFG